MGFSTCSHVSRVSVDGVTFLSLFIIAYISLDCVIHLFQNYNLKGESSQEERRGREENRERKRKGILWIHPFASHLFLLTFFTQIHLFEIFKYVDFVRDIKPTIWFSM